MVGYVIVHVYHTVQLGDWGEWEGADLVWHRSMFVMSDHEVKARWTSE